MFLVAGLADTVVGARTLPSPSRGPSFASGQVAGTLKGFCAPFSSLVEVGIQTGLGDIVERWCSTLLFLLLFLLISLF